MVHQKSLAKGLSIHSTSRLISITLVLFVHLCTQPVHVLVSEMNVNEQEEKTACSVCGKLGHKRRHQPLQDIGNREMA